MGSTMTDKTEAQPEALRLEVHQECADFATSLRSAATVVQLQGREAPPSFLKAADLFEHAAAEIQQLKAQLSARQAAPDGWRLVPVEPTDAMLLTLASDGEAEVIAKHPEWHPMLLDRSGVPQRYAAMLSAAPPRSPKAGRKHMKKTEREMLQLAAKAAGIVSLRWGIDKPERQMSGEGEFIGATWDPLRDNGGALQLAMDLGLEVSYRHDLGQALVVVPGGSRGRGEYWQAGKPADAARLAIVRAAADIGKSMP